MKTKRIDSLEEARAELQNIEVDVEPVMDAIAEGDRKIFAQIYDMAGPTINPCKLCQHFDDCKIHEKCDKFQLQPQCIFCQQLKKCDPQVSPEDKFPCPEFQIRYKASNGQLEGVPFLINSKSL